MRHKVLTKLGKSFFFQLVIVIIKHIINNEHFDKTLVGYVL